MKTPILDPRDRGALMEEIRRRARSYTPEWRFDPDDMDAGGALAALFSQMFAQTVDRYNRVLHKNYIEFLNLLAVRQQPVTPAEGYVAVDIAPGTDRPVEIARDTLFYHDGADGERINYLSDETIFATPARITGLVTVDPAADAVAVRGAQEAEEPFDLFHVPPERNLQRHAFTLRHDEALRLSRPGWVRVTVGASAYYLAQHLAQRLCRPEFAVWEYYSRGAWRAFDEAAADGDQVVLRKDSRDPIEICPEEGALGGRCVRCTMTRDQDNSALTVRALGVTSGYRLGESCGCDEAMANDARVDAEEGGYCFDDPLLAYDAFYIASDEVLCKRGAQVTLEMDLHIVERRSDQEQARYEFKDKFVIEKNDTPPEPAKKYISRVAWEYWNGVGWTHLRASGDVNPFGLDGEGKKRVTFTLPEDAQPTFVGAVERCWVRCRVVAVENPFDLYATRLLPFLTGLRLSYRYSAPRPVQQWATENNLQRAQGDGSMGATLYAPLPDARPALYLCFDDAPAGYPAPLYVELQGRARDRRRLQAEARLARGFEPVKCADGLEDCAHSGVLSLYLPPQLQRAQEFGLDGWFVRLVDVTGRASYADWPRLRRIVPNCVRVTQRQTAPDAVFSTDIHEANKRVRLDETPVLSEQVWVDERGALNEAAMAELEQREPQDVRAERAGDGRLTRFFVRWRRVESLALCGPQDRAYELDAEAGRIAFGDGVHGAIPPAGDDNIAVRYSFGGGSRGNIEQGAITGITTTAAGVTRVRNFLPICGGNDLQSVELVERLGPQRLRHRGRAVTRADFEALVLEEFSEVRAVRCFPNTDETGAPGPGQVTVVLLTGSGGSEPHAAEMCERVAQYLGARCDGRLRRSGLHVRPATEMTVSVTARVEVDAPEHAAQAERGVQTALDALLDPTSAPGAENPIGALPSQTDLYAALRRVPHVMAVRDVLMEGSYMEDNARRVVALDADSAFPFAVPRSGRHTIRV